MPESTTANTESVLAASASQVPNGDGHVQAVGLESSIVSVDAISTTSEDAAVSENSAENTTEAASSTASPTTTSTTNTSQVPPGLSKRAFKRLQKEKAITGTSTSTNEGISNDSSPRESRETSVASTSDIGSGDAYIDHLQKRIRNLQKRKARLDKYHEIAEEAKAKNLPLPLNADQLSALAFRETVESPLKELQEALVIYKAQVVDRIAQEKIQKAQYEADTAKALEAARLEGLAEGREQLRLTVQFLRAASFKRQLVSVTPVGEINSFENLLKIVYAGDETTLVALDELFKGSEKKVDEEAEESITFAKVKEISLIAPEDFYKPIEDENEEGEDDAKNKNDSDNTDNSNHKNVSTGGVAAEQSSRPIISFLQEEVTEEPQYEDKNEELTPQSAGTASTALTIDSPTTTASNDNSPTISNTEVANTAGAVPTGPASGTDSNPKSKKNYQRRPYYNNRNYKPRKGQQQNQGGENKSSSSSTPSATTA